MMVRHLRTIQSVTLELVAGILQNTFQNVQWQVQRSL